MGEQCSPEDESVEEFFMGQRTRETWDVFPQEEHTETIHRESRCATFTVYAPRRTDESF